MHRIRTTAITVSKIKLGDFFQGSRCMYYLAIGEKQEIKEDYITKQKNKFNSL